MTEQEMRQKVAELGAKHDEEILKLLKLFLSSPRCPKCNSPRLRCPEGHVWEILKGGLSGLHSGVL